ncbi:class I adenylate-forming enzyme family protein [Meiothermus granaticius]|uniref:Long-chain-fatty-acid--CoA ligase n=1 Tax=Meiothermus granaticius NBRC 107808 TaxID=1227551 RepID=A0A399FCI6_9DEIN|nr:AMP-binding protein [Meiothermus granaticius]RIH92722.1 Long-chain-fatty-acid--CoA ligase [Meiothermus granaticius NBRC 107808]
MELNANWLARLAGYHPQRPAVFWRGDWISYQELYARALRAAESLAGLGIGRGDRVGVLGPNHLGYLELYFAAPLLGFVPTLFNHRLSRAELAGLVEYTRPQALFYSPESQGLAQALHPRAYALEGLSTPMFHAALNALATPLLYLGARLLIQERFDPGEYLHWVDEHRVSLLFLVPTMFQMLANHPGFTLTEFSSVRWAISGGAPCPAPVREAFRAKGIRFKQGYGLTECGVNCFTLEPEEAERYPDSVGRPMPHLWARLVDPQGHEAQGEGELWLSGPAVMSGYFERPEASAAALVAHEGRTWLKTGDLAQRDAEGRFYIVGRAKEMFISGGENVYPIEVERALYDHPAVAECAVAGVPDAKWGEVGIAFVVLKGQASEEELRAFLKGRLAGYKVPKRIVFLPELPKSGPGKILKSELVAHWGGSHA